MKRVLFVILGSGIVWLVLAMQPAHVEESFSTTPKATHEILPASSQKIIPELFTVAAVIDGDTIEVWNGEVRQRVRYIGINTPEIYPRPECYGAEAATYNQTLVSGKSVRLERDVSDTDQYGRWLRYVYVEEMFVNEELIKAGYAHARVYPPDTAKQGILGKAEKTAKQAAVGRWSACGGEAV